MNPPLCGFGVVITKVGLGLEVLLMREMTNVATDNQAILIGGNLEAPPQF
jgi:hypothetical protein